jgi:DNA-binding SARP family transcriptional activator
MTLAAVASDSPFRLHCLGPACIIGPGGRRVALRTRKHAAMLYVLVRRGGVAVPREQLVELLWADGDMRKARHSVAQAVSLVNKAFAVEAVVPAGKDLIALRGGVVDTDVAEFEAHASAGRLGEAAALWKGELFEGLWLRRAGAFERYLQDERARLGRVLRRVLGELAEERRRAGDWNAMRAAAEQLLSSDPLDEGSMLLYLESLSLLGERTLALRRYAEFERRLRIDLDAEPNHSLAAWARRHRRTAYTQPIGGVVSARVTETQALPSVRPLFGREAEFACLWSAWEEAKRNNGRLLLVHGEPGVGKTALAAKLANQVHVMGGSVAYVRCYATEKAVPFAPAANLVRQLSRLAGFVSMDAVWIGELTRLAPELRDRYPAAPLPMAIDDSARSRLCDAILNASEAVTSEAPALLVVDDVQDADEASFAVLHYLGRHCSTMSALLLLVARRTAGDPWSTLPAHAAVHLDVQPLSDAATMQLVGQILAQRGREASPAEMDAIAATAQGYPLRAIEAAVAHASSDFAAVSTSASVSAFHVSVEARLASLGESAHLVAVILAVAGHPMTDFELSATTALPLAHLASAVDALLEAGFIGRTGAHLHFVHESYRRIVEETTPEALRNHAHKRMASFLSQPSPDPAKSFLVAKHLSEANEADGAFRQALVAAEFAYSLGATRERAAATQLAHDLKPKDPHLTVTLCAAYLSLGDFARVRAILAATSGHEALTPALSAEFEWLEIATDVGDGTATVPQTRERLRNLVRRTESFPSIWAAQLALVRFCEKSWAHRLAIASAGGLWRRARVDGSDQALGHGHTAIGFIFAKYYSPFRALRHLERGLHHAQVSRDWELELLCRDGLGAVTKMVGRFGDSINHIKMCIALARKTLNPQAEAKALTNLSVTEIATGDIQSALLHLAESERLAESFGEWPFRVFQLLNLGILKMEIGKYQEALDALHLAHQLALKQEIGQALHAVVGGLGVCAARIRDLELLRNCARTLRADLSSGWRVYADRGMAEAAIAWDLHLNQGEMDTAIESLKRAMNELRRRDVDHSLTLDLELVRLVEHGMGTVQVEHREALARRAARHGAHLYARLASRAAGLAGATD